MSKQSHRDNDLDYQGRSEYYLDIDRMISEGMAGGTVNIKYDHPSVDYYHEIVEREEAPRKS